MRTRTTWATTLLILLLGGAALAENQEDVTKLPGYVDFGALKIFGDQDTTVEIFLTKELINMVAAVSRSSDPELSLAIAKLKQIRVQTFKIQLDKLDELERKTDDVSHRLEQQGWQTMVRIKQPKEGKQTYVYTKWVDNRMQGLVVMDIDPRDEASFVNIVGEIDPEQIGRISSKFNIGDVDSLEGHIRGGMHHRDRDRDKDKGKSKE